MRKIRLYSIIVFCAILLGSACQVDSIPVESTLTNEPNSVQPVSTATILPEPTITPTVDPAVISPDNIYKLDIIDRWGNGRVYGVALSPDKQTIAVAMTTGVYLYDIRSNKEIMFIDWPAEMWSNVESKPYRPLSFSPNGKLLAIGYEDIILWNIENNSYKKQIHINVDDFTPVDIAFSPDGQTIAALTLGFYPAYDSPGGSFSLYSTSSGERIFNEIYYPSPYYETNNFYFLQGNRIMFAGGTSHNDHWGYYVSIINSSSGELTDRYEYDNHISRVNYDGTIFAIQPHFNGYLDIIDIKTGHMISNVNKTFLFIPGEKNRQLQLIDKQWTVLESFDKTICTIESDNIPKFYDTRDFNFFNNTLVIWNELDHQVRGWDLATCELTFTLKIPIYDNKIMINIEEGFFITDDLDFLALQSGNAWKQSFSFVEFNSPSNKLHWSLSLDEKTLILLGPDDLSHLEVWDIPSAKRIKVIETGTDDFGLPNLGISPDGKIAIFSSNFGIQLWNTETGEMITRVPFIKGFIFENPNGEEFAVLNEHTLYFVNFKTGEVGQVIEFWQYTPDVTFSYKWDAFLYRNNNDGEICFKNIDTGEDIVLHEMPDINFNPNKNESAPLSIFFGLYIQTYDINKEGTILAGIVYTDTGHSIRLWNLQDGKTIRDIALPIWHQLENFSSDGKYIITSYDHVLYIWGINEE